MFIDKVFPAVVGDRASLRNRLAMEATARGLTNEQANTILAIVQQRLEHLRDAYAVTTAKTQNHDILLVDDLYRSGATLEAVTNALRSKGNVQKIFALTLTRTRSHR